MYYRAGKILLGFILVIAVCIISAFHKPYAFAQTTTPGRLCTLGHVRSSESIVGDYPGHHLPVKHKMPRKMKVHIRVFKDVPPQVAIALRLLPLQDDHKVVLFPQVYTYLYFSEINPPPPKTC